METTNRSSKPAIDGKTKKRGGKAEKMYGKEKHRSQLPSMRTDVSTGSSSPEPWGFSWPGPNFCHMLCKRLTPKTKHKVFKT